MVPEIEIDTPRSQEIKEFEFPQEAFVHFAGLLETHEQYWITRDPDRLSYPDERTDEFFSGVSDILV